MSQLQPLANLKRRLTREAGGMQRALLAQLAAHWYEIVGSDLAGLCRPVRLTWVPIFKSGETHEEIGQRGILHLAAAGANATLLSHRSQDILAKVNFFCGFPARGKEIKEVRFVPGLAANSPDKPMPSLYSCRTPLFPETADEEVNGPVRPSSSETFRSQKETRDCALEDLLIRLWQASSSDHR